MNLAIHNVFIAKENILFLEEWIDYHIQLGFNKFYLYNNSKVKKKSKYDSPNKNLVPGKVNKYGFDFNSDVKLNDEEVQSILDKIEIKYSGMVQFIEWSPIDKNGAVRYAQDEANNHCLKILKRNNIDWAAHIDMDEFITIKEGSIKNIKEYLKNLDEKIFLVRMLSRNCGSRFRNLDKLCIEIDSSVSMAHPAQSWHSGEWTPGVKNLYKPGDMEEFVSPHSLKFHDIYLRTKKANINEICFNHYKMHDPKRVKLLTTKVNNINPEILLKIKENSKKYIIKKWVNL